MASAGVFGGVASEGDKDAGARWDSGCAMKVTTLNATEPEPSAMPRLKR